MGSRRSRLKFFCRVGIRSVPVVEFGTEQKPKPPAAEAELVERYERPGPRCSKKKYKHDIAPSNDGPAKVKGDLEVTQSVRDLMDFLIDKIDIMEIFGGTADEYVDTSIPETTGTIKVKVEPVEKSEVKVELDSLNTPTCSGNRIIAKDAVAAPEETTSPIIKVKVEKSEVKVELDSFNTPTTCSGNRIIVKDPVAAPEGTTVEYANTPIPEITSPIIKVKVERSEVKVEPDSFITPTCSGNRIIAKDTVPAPTKKKPDDTHEVKKLDNGNGNEFITDLTKVLSDQPSTSTSTCTSTSTPARKEKSGIIKSKSKNPKLIETVKIDDSDSDDAGTPKSIVKKRKKTKEKESLDIAPFCLPKPNPKTKPDKKKKKRKVDDDVGMSSDSDTVFGGRKISTPSKGKESVEVKQMRVILKEVEKENPNMDTIKDAMRKTFESRKRQLQIEGANIDDILHSYPAFKFIEILKLEFDLATNKKLQRLEDDLESELLRNINKTLKTKNTLLSDSLGKLGEVTEGKDEDVQHKIKLSMGMLSLGVRKCPEIGESLFRLRLSSDDEVLPITELRPFIDIIDLWTDDCKMVIYVEKNEVITVNNLYDAVLITYCLYWIFNLAYDDRLIRLFSYFDYVIGNPQDIYKNKKAYLKL